MKKVLIVLLAMLVMALVFSLVSCDEDETDGSGAQSESRLDIEETFDSGIFGSEFSDLVPPNYEFPDEEV